MKTTNGIKILVALDHNQTALRVAEVSCALANSMHAEIFLLHVVSDPVLFSIPAFTPIVGLTDEMDIFKKQYADLEGLKFVTRKFLAQLKHHLGDNAIKTIVGEGEIATAILDIAKAYKVNLIAMGTHSTKWLENIVMGSVARDVLLKSTVPLFIVPTKKY
jgi:nucleotide-binding universal stress UspA family protein